MLYSSHIYVPKRDPNRHPRQQSSLGQHGAQLGPIGPRLAPCWPHEPCYQGHDTIMMPLLRQYDVATSFWRNADVVFASCACWDQLHREIYWCHCITYPQWTSVTPLNSVQPTSWAWARWRPRWVSLGKQYIPHHSTLREVGHHLVLSISLYQIAFYDLCQHYWSLPYA